MTAALLFDLDGTLVDTESQHFSAFQRVLAPHGVALDEAQYREHILGAPNATIAARFLPTLDSAEREATIEAKETAYRALVGELAPAKGALDLLEFAKRNALAVAVVTNAPRANAELVLAAAGLTKRLPIVICGAELARGKPDPLPYLTGLERTRATAARSIAFEDSVSGIRAAVAAGLYVIGMTTTLDAAMLVAAGAHMAVADFTDPRIVERIRVRALQQPADHPEAP
jgi:HAD superfamily hydrolase (TIGR01509 family)